VKLGFKYDNLVVEESAQILEVETFIPMLLQNHDSVEGCRLKRVVLIGDHHQLPPVVQNMAFQKYGKLDQSLFARFIRLGTPHVQLDKQGRARTEIAHLYRWRYQGLGDLPVINQKDLYKTANAGFANEFQMINVEDFQGRGESTPSPFFYQNLGEAEYVVAVYQYMRLLGYPADRISILSTYNGQKDLIRDILEKRCAPFDFFGMPARVTTADKYQGQQNDYVLLSLVRTNAVGHLRDVRRLVVAMSRARAGLYVFGRASLFANCYELAPAFNILLKKSQKLELVMGERYESMARLAGTAPKDASKKITVEDVSQMGVMIQHMANMSQR
jgi:intron-binding protein aquarius